MSPLIDYFYLFFFSLTFLLINMINYYYFNNFSNSKFSNKSKISTNWKW